MSKTSVVILHIVNNEMHGFTKQTQKSWPKIWRLGPNVLFLEQFKCPIVLTFNTFACALQIKQGVHLQKKNLWSIASSYLDWSPVFILSRIKTAFRRTIQGISLDTLCWRSDVTLWGSCELPTKVKVESPENKHGSHTAGTWCNSWASKREPHEPLHEPLHEPHEPLHEPLYEPHEPLHEPHEPLHEPHESHEPLHKPLHEPYEPHEPLHEPHEPLQASSYYALPGTAERIPSPPAWHPPFLDSRAACDTWSHPQ